jgi:hypothetical protein
MFHQPGRRRPMFDAPSIKQGEMSQQRFNDNFFNPSSLALSTSGVCTAWTKSPKELPKLPVYPSFYLSNVQARFQ